MKNIDFNELLEELRSLDTSDPGRWPLPVLAGAVVLWLVVLTFGLLYFVVWSSESPDLDKYHKQELALRDEFRAKHAQAVNLGVYRQQLADIQRSFGALLRELPGKTEVPNLLVDISQTGLAAGLQEKLFQPGPEQKKDFYAELPIQIRLTGSYHQFGQFVSGIAALPRIVTLHDIDIRPQSANSYDQLIMDVTAKTYRYLDEDEQAAANAPKAPPRRGGR
ncbi:MAG TPA: type 4a pilus biogenesis protein PilO [Steroidobacteraceae bacterium]|nr:type 4a pilus biogenesis protein PilO [Steroidobacteraceae bacterium]